MTTFGFREVLSVTSEEMAKAPTGQWAELCVAVFRAAERKRLIPMSPDHSPGSSLGPHGQERVKEFVREAMWSFLVKGVLVFGMDTHNPNWPFYKVTERGRAALSLQGPQPYDPDGFIAHFDSRCAGVDPAVRGYVVEATRAFNVDCLRSAAVMIGCASEKLLLLLCDAFEAAITDPAKKAKFSKDLGAKWAISHKYETVRDRLGLMVQGKRLPRDLAETAQGELPSGFDLLRRCRNAAGHPDVPGDVSSDSVFLNLRTFTEYASRVTTLIAHFGSNAADW